MALTFRQVSHAGLVRKRHHPASRSNYKGHKCERSHHWPPDRELVARDKCRCGSALDVLVADVIVIGAEPAGRGSNASAVGLWGEPRADYSFTFRNSAPAARDRLICKTERAM